MRILIIDLERTAMQIGTANVKLSGGIYLIVQYFKSSDIFTYRWGKTALTRDGAILLLEQNPEY